MAGLSRFDSLSEERVRDRFAVAAQLDYTQCLARIDNRTVVRNIFNGILDQFPVTEGIMLIEQYLDEAYPPLTPSDCDEILRKAGVEVEPRPIPAD